MKKLLIGTMIHASLSAFAQLEYSPFPRGCEDPCHFLDCKLVKELNSEEAISLIKKYAPKLDEEIPSDTFTISHYEINQAVTDDGKYIWCPFYNDIKYSYQIHQAQSIRYRSVYTDPVCKKSIGNLWESNQHEIFEYRTHYNFKSDLILYVFENVWQVDNFKVFLLKTKEGELLIKMIQIGAEFEQIFSLEKPIYKAFYKTFSPGSIEPWGRDLCFGTRLHRDQ
jgi:hypothetical protein